MRLTDLNENQTALMQEFLDQLAYPSVWERIFTIADALIGGRPVAVLSGGGVSEKMSATCRRSRS